MEFNDKYVSEKDQALPANKDKVVLSNDAFAIGEMLQEVVQGLRKVRI